MAEAIDNQVQLCYNLPWFIEDPAEALNRYLNPRCFVVVDFETNNKEFGSALNPDNHIVLTCWDVVYADGTVQNKHVWGDEYELAELEADIKQADFVVAHNAKFELQWLKRCGMELRDILVFDTFLAEWVLSGNLGGQKGWELNLDDTAARYGLPPKMSVAKQLIHMGVDPSDIPYHLLLPYCYRDVELSRKLFYMQVDRLRRDGLLHLALTRNLCCAALADLEFGGAELDAVAVKKEYEDTVKEFHELDKQLTALTGGVNMSSPKQLGEYLFKTLNFPVPKDHKGKPLETKKGLPKTDVKTLDKLQANTNEQREFLALYKRRNKLDSLLSKNLEFFRLVCEQRGGKFYGNINQGFTQTHRLASTGRPIVFDGLKKGKGVQFQNMPRNYKKLFTAHDQDYLCLEFDAAQLEFRVAAEMGHDPIATVEIIDGYDVHSYTAKVLTEAGELTDRQGAKASTFAPLYGGGGKTPAQRAYAEAFKAKYAGIANTQKEWTFQVLDAGKLRTPYGMIFHWPGTRMSNRGYIDNTTSIYNFPIQGFATAEIIPIALVYFWQKTKDLRCEIFNTIHDSICARVHKDDIEAAKQLSKVCMTTDVYAFLHKVYNYDFQVPLGIGVKVAKNWGATKTEEVWAVWPDGKETYVVKE